MTWHERLTCRMTSDDVTSTSRLGTCGSGESAAEMTQNTEYRNRPNPETRCRMASSSSGLSCTNFSLRFLRGETGRQGETKDQTIVIYQET